MKGRRDKDIDELLIDYALGELEADEQARVEVMLADPAHEDEARPGGIVR